MEIQHTFVVAETLPYEATGQHGSRVRLIQDNLVSALGFTPYDDFITHELTSLAARRPDPGWCPAGSQDVHMRAGPDARLSLWIWPDGSPTYCVRCARKRDSRRCRWRSGCALAARR